MFGLKKIRWVLLFVFGLLLAGCSSAIVPPLGGFYQSEITGDYTIQIGIQPEENTFMEYIENREVDRGIIKKITDDKYLFESEKQEFEITLTSDDTFEVQIAQINGGDPIELKNIDKVPTYITTEFDDVEEFEELLNKK